MKPLIALLVCFTLVAIPGAFAQPNIGIGAKVGLNIANASFSPDLPAGITKSTRMGFMFGGVVEIGFAGPLSIQAEPMYVQKGNVVEGPLFVDQTTGFPVTGKNTSKLALFEVPILLKAKFPAGPVKPYVFAGPSIGFILSATETDEPQGFPSTDTDIKSTLNSTDFGLVFGAGAEFKVAPLVALTLDARYSLGLTDLSKGVPGEVTHTSVKTTGIQILAGVLFHL